jgi:hypothetical protein
MFSCRRMVVPTGKLGKKDHKGYTVSVCILLWSFGLSRGLNERGRCGMIRALGL